MAMTPRERSLKRAKLMKRLAEDLDAVRAQRLFNTAGALRALSELGLSDGLWSELRQLLVEIARIPQREPIFPRVRRFDSISNSLLWASLALSLTSLLSLALLRGSEVLVFIFMVSALVLLNVAYALKLYVLAKLRWIYSKHIDEIRSRDDLLRRAVDQLLARMRGELRKAGVEPSSVTFKMYSGDYSQLRVVKRGRGGMYVLAFR